ncbi:hypothetical protein TeGR_g3738 [Tetraparma gracilis]|uniref:Uncharacterized protein n=1 Tax=Tetraparma gracilis TaxID=2962635 RepID=A0ABQ6N514_9STRA|nr:hypothetical protein TeGR_g3738 [Tetraparma gracilis]
MRIEGEDRREYLRLVMGDMSDEEQRGLRGAVEDMFRAAEGSAGEGEGAGVAELAGELAAVYEDVDEELLRRQGGGDLLEQAAEILYLL